jgi:hypothetical protein
MVDIILKECSVIEIDLQDRLYAGENFINRIGRGQAMKFGISR